MILPFWNHKVIKILIPFRNLPTLSTRASLILLLVLIFAQYYYLSPLFSCAFTSSADNNNNPQHIQTTTMKVHPMPKKRNITVQYGLNSTTLSEKAQAVMGGGTNNKLRRLPHIFSRVLELPFRSDADVSIEESPDCFRFIAETENIGNMRAHTVEIHPGVTKIVIRGSEFVELSLNELELDMWRFRLPESTRPELASAVCVDGELIVTVPKMEGMDDAEDGGGDGEGEVWGDGNGNGEFRGGMGGRLVLVQ